MTQEALFDLDHDREGVGETRDTLDRHFTLYPLALVCCLALRDRLGLNPRRVLEPSVGDGNFVLAARKVWPGCFVLGVDLDLEAKGLAMCDEHHRGDWLKFGAELGPPPAMFDLAVGNPPFSGKTGIKHVETTQRVARTTAFVLPWGPLGGVGRWTHLMSGPGCPTNAWPIPGRPWPDHIRETALHVWQRGDKRTWTRVEKLPRWKS